MINAILAGIITLITNLTNTLLLPIDAAITSYLPALSNAFTAIGNFLNICVSCIGWVISLLGLNANVISLIVIYYGFALTVPAIVYVVKLAIKWYNALKP